MFRPPPAAPAASAVPACLPGCRPACSPHAGRTLCWVLPARWHSSHLIHPQPPCAMHGPGSRPGLFLERVDSALLHAGLTLRHTQHAPPPPLDPGAGLEEAGLRRRRQGQLLPPERGAGGCPGGCPWVLGSSTGKREKKERKYTCLRAWVEETTWAAPHPVMCHMRCLHLHHLPGWLTSIRLPQRRDVGRPPP